MTSNLPNGFVDRARTAPDGSLYPGRFTLFDVQITGDKEGVFVTSTVSVSMISDACLNNLVWTDQSVQRGIRPEFSNIAERYLSLQAGFPDKAKYVYDQSRSEDIADKLLRGERLFLNPLIWNLRPGDFEAFLDLDEKRLHLYDGRIFLPDSHHRHQAIVHAANAYRQAPADYPKFSLEKQFTVELYFMSSEDEGEYFYEKNQLGKPADKSKALDLTTQDNFALVAKQAISMSPSLAGNVNRVTDRLTAKNRQVMTLSTMVGMVRSAAAGDIARSQVGSLATSFATFYELLSDARPELKLLTEEERIFVRKNSMVDQAVVLHGFAPIIRMFHDQRLAASSSDVDAQMQVAADWERRLSVLTDEVEDLRRRENEAAWKGDFFDRSNPVWREFGILQPTKSGGTAVSNTRQTRNTTAELLSNLLGLGTAGAQ